MQVCDVSSLNSVRQLAVSYAALKQPLHVLVNNAGILVRINHSPMPLHQLQLLLWLLLVGQTP